jgi:hypothetical protein
MFCSAASAKLEVLAVIFQQTPAPKHDFSDKLPLESGTRPWPRNPTFLKVSASSKVWWLISTSSKDNVKHV